jgi:CheY-like chemotaxis protein/anti-sigma regulatory factor (Ser/Thr protein kinase)
MELNPINYDFPALMGNIGSMFKYVSQKKGIDFIYESGGDVPKFQFGDDIRLRQVITNICGNAVKFTQEGHVRLTVTGAPETIEFVIADTGMGIKKEDMPTLFQSFAQADTQKNRSVAGTGLGLAISKSFVDMMGGTIVFDSEYGKGTTFTIKIPRVDGDGDKILASAELGKSFSAPDAKVLIVDDNPFNLKVAKGLLELVDIKARAVLSGQNAIDAVSRVDFDIVFMDHMMPEMDGVEATANIRALGGKHEQQAIVALTANAIAGAKEMFLQNGFDDFLSKPIEQKQLFEILRRWLPAELITEKL